VRLAIACTALLMAAPSTGISGMLGVNSNSSCAVNCSRNTSIGRDGVWVALKRIQPVGSPTRSAKYLPPQARIASRSHGRVKDQLPHQSILAVPHHERQLERGLAGRVDQQERVAGSFLPSSSSSMELKCSDSKTAGRRRAEHAQRFAPRMPSRLPLAKLCEQLRAQKPAS